MDIGCEFIFATDPDGSHPVIGPGSRALLGVFVTSVRHNSIRVHSAERTIDTVPQLLLDDKHIYFLPIVTR